MEVKCTQSKCNMLLCRHKYIHTFTPDCEIKCCNIIGMVKCRTVENE